MGHLEFLAVTDEVLHAQPTVRVLRFFEGGVGLAVPGSKKL